MSNQEAIHLMKEKKYEQAVQTLTGVIEKNPQDPIGYINFGNLLIHMNDLNRALVFFEKAIELDPQSATAYYGLGNLYYEQKNYEQAIENFQEAIALGLDISDVYFMLGMSLANRNHQMLAIPYLLRAIELDPNDEEKLFQYGLSLAKAEYLNDAKEIFEQVIALNNKHSDAHYNLGILSLYHDKHSDALAHFKTALQFEPHHILAANGKTQVEKMLSKKKN